MKKNPELNKLIEELSGKEEKIWKNLARRLSGPRRNLTLVNLARLNRYASNKEKIVVPGKVLGYGNIEKEILVSALSFSGEAERKIKKAGGKCYTIGELLKESPKGEKIRIFG
ncbi:MAG: 50S ribosomal protein L18e [archaeon]|nr:MAG: 50S ribosomal protein L18e [archaeon]